MSKFEKEALILNLEPEVNQWRLTFISSPLSFPISFLCMNRTLIFCYSLYSSKDKDKFSNKEGNIILGISMAFSAVLAIYIGYKSFIKYKKKIMLLKTLKKELGEEQFSQGKHNN